jgi:hypothetical protein
MATRIRVRKGDTEVEYEGSEQFLKAELASLLQAASTFPAGSVGEAAAGAAPTGKGSSRKTSGRKSSARGSAARKTSGRTPPGGKTSPAAGSAGPPADEASAGPDAKRPAASPTADIAGKIGCNHGTDLVLAASAQLSLGAGQKSFSRAALLGEMKTAEQYYKPVYGKNLSRYLRNLIKERQLNEPRPGNYALSAPARREMGKILAG